MICIPFTSPEANLSNSGGKGSNLARLTRAGFPVPQGFILQTDAYRSFVSRNELQELIDSALDHIKLENPDSVEQASVLIRTVFASGKIPEEIVLTVRNFHSQLNNIPLAVRSSATTEDLPELSFAGQQDTYLNIIEINSLFEAVINCWSSLWTGRAIGYRMRNNIDNDEVSLAVVVQEMVQSDVSGVLFTTNPLTGLLSETVIDATFGLGEVLVSGQVEPDHFVIDSISGELIEKTLGTKELSTRSKPGGGVENIREMARDRLTLTDDEIHQLVKLGQQVQNEYGAPQDIEWAFVGKKLYLLQARPITSLFPIPEISFDPLKVWFSFGTVQGLVGPITPLGQNTILHVVLGAGKLFGLKLNYGESDLFALAGERIWIKISDVIRHPLGYRIVGGLLDYVEPSVKEIVFRLVSESNLGAGSGKFKLSTFRRFLFFALPIGVQMVCTMLWPKRARDRFETAIDDYLATAYIPPADDRFERLVNLTTFIKDRIANALPFLLPKFIPLFGPSMALLNLLNKITGQDRALILEVMRGLPDNVTTEMDLALWKSATVIRKDTVSEELFTATDATQLACLYLDGSLPLLAQSAIADFMYQYGMRGVGEIDFGQPRWRDDPTPVMQMLKSYLNITPERAPDVQFAKGQKIAEKAIQRLVEAVRHQPGGWIKEKLVRGAAWRIRTLMSVRESPKFFAIRTMGIGREALIAIGQEFVDAGTLEHPDDLVFMELSELEALAGHENRDWMALIAERRNAYERELRRRQVPRVLVSDGRVFYEGVGAMRHDDDVITGSPVSPGVAEGRIHIVLDPSGTQLSPGEIIVCPGTDPAWTPLFLAAGGLITEVGGMMTHGSVVAREYGIPAVVGVHQATLRLKDGQRIRMDGSTGTIALLE